MNRLDTLWTEFNRQDLKDRAGTFSTWNKLDNEARYLEVIQDPGMRTYLPEDFGYQFNSHGFRSEEFDAECDIKILYAGCSVAEGIGLPVEHTWSHHINKFVEAEVGSEIKRFSVGKAGTSIDACVRYIHVAIESKGFRPDMVIFLVPPLRWNEFVYPVLDTLGWMDFVPAPHCIRTKKDEVLFEQYNAFITPLQRFHEAIKSLLFLKLFLDSKNIPFVLTAWNSSLIPNILPEVSIPHHMLLKEHLPESLKKHVVVAPFVQDSDKPLVRASLTASVSWPPADESFEYKYPYNMARDGIHFGPNTNWNFAKALFNELKLVPSFSSLLNKK